MNDIRNLRNNAINYNNEKRANRNKVLTTLLAIVGVIGIIFGFAIQDTLKDIKKDLI